MKPLLLSTYLEGGAGGAAYRLHQGLRQIGVPSHVLMQRIIVPRTYDDSVIAPETKPAAELARLRPTLDRLPLSLYSGQRGMFSPNWLPDSIAENVRRLNPDVINMHWVLDGFVRVETLPRLRKPIFWTLHDMWPFTGGCDYSGDCDRYTRMCGACPQLDSGRERDLSRWTWRRKAKAWQDLDLTIITPSAWMASCARASSLFGHRRIEIIPNGIDTNRFKPIDRRVARRLLQLPQDKQLILFGAWINDGRKGFDLLEAALRRLSRAGWGEKMNAVFFGISRPKDPPDLGCKSHYLGRLNDDISLALTYAAADVFMAPSIQDNLPTTLIESIACGTPCVAFDVGGVPDIIEHEKNGYIARPFETEDLARGIAWVLAEEDRHRRLACRARQKAEEQFTMEQQARRYAGLFSESIAGQSRTDPQLPR
jgi:glycosyltransferase involved in cell wall biosynthesis